MAKDPPVPSHSDSWDEVRENIDGFTPIQPSLHPGRYDARYDYSGRFEGLSPKTFQQMEPTMSSYETVNLVRSAVDNARQGMQQSLEGSERVGEAVKLKLTVDLGHKGIEMLPEEVVQILKRDVERLVLSHNQIWHMPYKFAECTALTYLNLRGNKFKEFPKAIYKLPQLQILDLSRNKIAKIPDEIKNMKALRVLSLMNNKLENVAYALGFLDNLKIIKLTGNPLSEELKRVMEGNDGASPLMTPLADNEKDANLTKRIKKSLKQQAAAAESGGESSSEGHLDTPRPLKRNLSLRFPVVPTTSGSESASEIRSPSLSAGLTKPVVPLRSHFRAGSGPHGSVTSFSSHSAAIRRPGVTPLIIGNERNRSNSESVLQATQNTRNKRMGMITRKHSELGTVDESRTNRNSHHYRGLSHASVLRDKNTNSARTADSTSSGFGVPSEGERQRGTFMSRLSSLPEYKRESHAPNNLVEGAKSVLYSLHQIHPNISTLITVIKDGRPKRSSLERVYYNASTHLQQLDKLLYYYNRSDNTSTAPSKKLINDACKACLISYKQIGALLLRHVPQLVASGDQKYLRTTLLLVFGSLVESRNACLNFGIDLSKVNIPKETPPIPTIREEGSHGLNSLEAKERPARRLRSETTLRQPRNNHNHFNSAPSANAAVPLYPNGRSRSNSRTNTLTASATPSLANTPRSGESFLVPSTPQIQQGRVRSPSVPGSAEFDQEQDFERIYLALSQSVEHGLRAVPRVSLQFSRCLDVAVQRYAGKDIQDLWSRLISRSRFCLDMCEALKMRLSTIKLKEPGVRNARDFWELSLRFVSAFTKLVDGIQEAKDLNLVPLEIPRILQPVHKSSKIAINNIKNSPWAYVLTNDPPPRDQTHYRAQMNGHTSHSNNNSINGYNYSRDLATTHTRSRGGSGSSSSPYLTSVPATPLSAALGPAAQATVPSTPGTSASLDRSFQGDVFQRADSLLNMQHTMLQRRG